MGKKLLKEAEEDSAQREKVSSRYDKEPLTQTEILHFQKRLLEMQIKIRNDVRTKWRGDLGKDYREQLSMSSDDEDLPDINGTEEIGISLIESQGRELLEIEDALVRIEEGTFGICMDCGNRINKKRLNLIPTTSRCTVCETAIERKRKASPRYRKLRVDM